MLEISLLMGQCVNRQEMSVLLSSALGGAAGLPGICKGTEVLCPDPQLKDSCLKPFTMLSVHSKR